MHYLPWLLFGVFAIVAWLLLDMFTGKRDRASERLDELRNPQSRRRDELLKGGKKGDSMAKVFEKAAPSFAKPLQPKNEIEANKLKAKLSAAGFRSESASSAFLGCKLIGLVIGLVLFGGTTLATAGVGQKALVYTIGGAGLMFYMPDIIVAFLGSRRKGSIFLTLPDALDLMVVCVEAGLGLDQALRKVAEEMKDTARIISEEFSLSNFQLQMGRARTDVLRELGQRTGVDDLRSLAAILIQADKFGSSIAQALRVQSDSMRTRRRQLAEEKAAKTAVKLIFPLVIFIFPGIFVVLVGPAAITMVREMFPTMTGGH
jgi:tight adherence protein C